MARAVWVMKMLKKKFQLCDAEIMFVSHSDNHMRVYCRMRHETAPKTTRRKKAI